MSELSVEPRGLNGVMVTNPLTGRRTGVIPAIAAHHAKAQGRLGELPAGECQRCGHPALVGEQECSHCREDLTVRASATPAGRDTWPTK